MRGCRRRLIQPCRASLEPVSPGLSGFYAGNILGDFVWYGLIAAAVSSQRRLCSAAVYRAVIFLCGLILIILAAYFIATGVTRLIR